MDATQVSLGKVNLQAPPETDFDKFIVETGDVIDTRVTSHSETHISGGGSYGNNANNVIQPITSSTSHWTTNQFFIKSKDKESKDNEIAITLVDNPVAIRPGNRISLIAVGPPSKGGSYPYIVLFNHNTDKWDFIGSPYLSPYSGLKIHACYFGFLVILMVSTFLGYISPSVDFRISIMMTAVSVVAVILWMGLPAVIKERLRRFKRNKTRPYIYKIIDALRSGKDLKTLSL